MRSCSDWTWSTLLIDTPSCSAWMIAPMKLVSGPTSVRGDDVAQRIAACLADADLGQRPTELVRQRAAQLLDDLAQRGIEAEAGTHGDRQQVERVRDVQQDRPCWRFLMRRLSQNSGAKKPIRRRRRRGSDRNGEGR